MTVWKAVLSRTHKWAPDSSYPLVVRSCLEHTRTDAVRLQLYNKASSPNNAPRANLRPRTVSLNTSRRPDSMMYSWFPSSPSFMTVSPGGCITGYMHAVNSLICPPEDGERKDDERWEGKKREEKKGEREKANVPLWETIERKQECASASSITSSNVKKNCYVWEEVKRKRKRTREREGEGEKRQMHWWLLLTVKTLHKFVGLNGLLEELLSRLIFGKGADGLLHKGSCRCRVARCRFGWNTN